VRQQAASRLVVLGDKGYLGEEHIRAPSGDGQTAFRKRPTERMPGFAPPGEQATARLKTRRILCKLRCCPWRAGQLARAIHVLQTRENERGKADGIIIELSLLLYMDFRGERSTWPAMRGDPGEGRSDRSLPCRYPDGRANWADLGVVS
jgi:hypothetical protein